MAYHSFDVLYLHQSTRITSCSLGGMVILLLWIPVQNYSWEVSIPITESVHIYMVHNI